VKRILPLTIIFLGLVGYAVYRRTRPPAPQLVKWVALPEAEARAQATGRPILYDFSADWCTPCRKMAREVFADAEAAAYINDHYVPTQILSLEDVDDGNVSGLGGELMQKFGVKNYPTIVVTRVDGKPIYFGDYESRDQLLAFLRSALDKP
jgi:thiol:disulfide interchange protein